MFGLELDQIRRLFFDELLYAFLQPLNVLHVDAKQVIPVEKLHLDLPLVKRQSDVLTATVEAEIEPTLVLDVVVWRLNRAESILAAPHRKYGAPLRHNQVREDALTEVRRAVPEEQLALTGELLERDAVDTLVEGGVRVAELAEESLHFVQKDGLNLVLITCWLDHDAARDTVVQMDVAHRLL